MGHQPKLGSYGKNRIFGPKTKIFGPKKGIHFLKFTIFWLRPEKLVQRKKVAPLSCHKPKMAFPPLIIWAKALFFFEQLFPVVARTWWIPKSDRLFLGPKFRFLAQKSDFCHTTPILVNDPFLALGMTVNFPPWERFFDFPFRSYSCFRKKIPADMSKSLPPSHCGGTVCQ